MESEKKYRRSFLGGQDDRTRNNKVEKIANLCFVAGRKAKVKDSPVGKCRLFLARDFAAPMEKRTVCTHFSTFIWRPSHKDWDIIKL